MFKLGLIINPWAGIGGPLALKGSDGDDIVSQAMAQGAVVRALPRAIEALKKLTAVANTLVVYGYSGDMAGTAAESADLMFRSIGEPNGDKTSAADTIAAARELLAQGMDLILFVGGDGTARDIFEAVGDSQPVLGIPAGVKMHSGVYAVSPVAAGEIVLRLINGQLVDVNQAEVRDIDEQAFREGLVKSRFYGELLVPQEGRFLQHVKNGGREVEELVLQDIAADIIESMVDERMYLIGPGSTTRAIMDELALANTLLGVDAVLAQQLIKSDCSEQDLLGLMANHSGSVEIILTAIGGQGHILGRGNQQLSPSVLRAVGLENITIVATKTKITELNGRPLLVDSNDAELDEALKGYRKVVTGYHDTIMYPVGVYPADPESEESDHE